MASLCLSATAAVVAVGVSIPPSSFSTPSTSSSSSAASSNGVRCCLSSRNLMVRGFPRNRMSSRRSQVVCMAPDEEKMTRRSPLDFPIEWERPKPGRRPDIFPQFSPMKTPLPPPMPYDPPEEDEDEEEKKEEEEEDPDKEEQDNPEK